MVPEKPSHYNEAINVVSAYVAHPDSEICQDLYIGETGRIGIGSQIVTCFHETTIKV